MNGLDIGLSGLQTAQRAMEIIGTNIANAATAGYHRQEAVIQPVVLNGGRNASIGGSEVAEVRRSVDALLETEFLRRQPVWGQVSQELTTLQMAESALGDLDSGGLALALGTFFDSLRALSAQPESGPFRSLAVRSAEAAALQFQQLGAVLSDVDENLLHEAQGQVARVNGLVVEIAELNSTIQDMQPRGQDNNMLYDRRDQAILELSELLTVQVDLSGPNNAVKNVTAGGVPLVTGSSATRLEAGLGEDGELAISVEGANYYVADSVGGRLGGMMELKNRIVHDLRQRLDDLARAIIQGVNEIHVQGLGVAGSFSELTGLPVATGAIGQWNAGVSSGSFYVRVTDLATGQTTRTAIAVDPGHDSVADVAARLDQVAHLTSWVSSGALNVQAGAGYAFDFVPALLPGPKTSGLSGSSTVQITGAYEGQTNETYTAKVSGSGMVGIGDDLQVEVRNSAGELVKTISVGAGYAPGDRLEVADGVYLSFQSGDLKDGEQFTVEALADSDPTGFLAAVGMNTLFGGDSATTMQVHEVLLENPDLLATARAGGRSDNLNVQRMIALAQTPLAALGNSTMQDAYQQFVVDIGQQIQTRQARKDSLDTLMQQLTNQRDRVSGVDVNEEAAKLMMFEQMFQGMARYINTQAKALESLMQLL